MDDLSSPRRGKVVVKFKVHRGACPPGVLRVFYEGGGAGPQSTPTSTSTYRYYLYGSGGGCILAMLSTIKVAAAMLSSTAFKQRS